MLAMLQTLVPALARGRAMCHHRSPLGATICRSMGEATGTGSRASAPPGSPTAHPHPARNMAVHFAAGLVGDAAPLQRVLKKIDDLNSCDPRIVEDDGQLVPYELAYSRWLTGWVLQLAAGSPPSDELLIAARGQHVRRWAMPRSSYAEGRAPYLKWREDLKKMSTMTVIDFMKEEGFGPHACEKVEIMMMKKNFKDDECQLIEDALCLVFLQRQFSEFRLKESETKMIGILQKTWAKMGERGKAAALALVPALGAEEKALVLKALS